MIVLSLLLNIAVLVPVCYGIMTDAAWASGSYGEFTAARGILLSVYSSILLVSIGLLFLRDPKQVATLLLIQVVYKMLTPFAVGTMLNPVILSNLFIAGFHSITLFMISRESRKLNAAM